MKLNHPFSYQCHQKVLTNELLTISQKTSVNVGTIDYIDQENGLEIKVNTSHDPEYNSTESVLHISNTDTC